MARAVAQGINNVEELERVEREEVERGILCHKGVR